MRKAAFAALAVLVGALIAAVIFMGFTGPRSALAGFIIQAALLQRGFHFTAASLTARPHELVAERVAVVGKTGQTAFTADRIDVKYDPKGLLGESDRAFGLESAVLERPVLHVIREADGSFNVQSFFGRTTNTSAPATAPRAARLRFSLRIADGAISVENPTALARQGRAFAFDRLSGSLYLHEGALSTGTLSGQMRAQGATAPIRATLFENDATSFAQAFVEARDAPLAPVFDGLMPSKEFAVESGTADVTLRAYAIGYDPARGPTWSLGGAAAIRGGVLRVVPLIAPIVDIAGPVRFNGNVFTFGGLRGVANGVPVFGRGGIAIEPEVRFALDVSGAGRLSSVSRLFRFSKLMPLGGAVRLDLRIAGPLANLDVAGPIAFSNTVTYAGIPFDRAAGAMFYSNGHITLPDIGADYAGAHLNGGGDIDLSGEAPSGQFVVVGVMPAANLPVAANLNPGGTIQALVALYGPLQTIGGSGFARIVGGNGVGLRATFSASPQRLVIGPILMKSGGGQLMAAVAVDKSPGRSRRVSADVIADRAPLRLLKRAVELPGLVGAVPISVPPVTGILDGAIVLRGTTAAPALAASAHVAQLDVAGAQLGDVRLLASGSGSRVRITSATISGRDVHATVSGYAALAPNASGYAAALTGSGRVNLGAASGLAPARTTGRASGNFKAVLSRGRWLVCVAAASGDASIGGVPVRAASGIVGGDRSGANLFAGTAAAGSGAIAALGSLRQSGDAVDLWADRIDVRTLGGFGVPLDGGTAFGLGRIENGRTGPALQGSVLLANADYRGVPLAGDADIAFAGGRLTGVGRAAVRGDQADVSGSVAGIGGAASPSLDLVAQLRDADLGSLVAGYLPPALALTGVLAANVRVTGTAAAPRADGAVSVDTGTLRGVAFDKLRGVVHAAPGSIGVDGGSVTLGSSTLAFGGAFSQSAVNISAASSYLNLSDFNDFFDGYDTLDGIGSGRASISLTPGRVAGSGAFRLEQTKLVGIPLGHVGVQFDRRGTALAALVSQSGPIGAADLQGVVTLPPRRSAVPDFSHAFYDAVGEVRGLDLGVVMPLIGKEDLNVTGFLDARGSVRGQLRRPEARGDFKLHDGHVGKIPVSAFSGSLASDATSVGVRRAMLVLPFASATGDIRYEWNGSVVGDARVAAGDLHKVMTAFGIPFALSGSASAAIGLAGSARRPQLRAAIDSPGGAVAGVNFDRFSSVLSYAPGQLDIGDTQLALGKRGTVTLHGTLPVQLAPLGLGPPQRRVDLTLKADTIDLSAIDPLLGGAAKLGGTLDAQASATGLAGKPSLAGSARVRGGSLRSPYETTPATSINAQLAFRNDAVELTNFTGALGAGSFNVKGAAHVVPAVGLRKAAGLQYWMRASLRNAQLDVPNWLNGGFDGDISLTKSGATPFLSGDVLMHDGVVPFSAIYALAGKFSGAAPPATTTAPGVSRLRPGHTIVYGGALYGGGTYVLTSSPGGSPTPAPFTVPSIDLNVGLAAGKNVSVKGSGFNLSAAGGITVAGNTLSPTIDGSFSSQRGLVTYFDTNFRILNGVVTFDKNEGLLPSIDVEAITSAGDEDITLRITGRVDRLSTDLSAIPPLSRDQIIALLLHAPALQSVVEGSTPNAAQTVALSEAQAFFNAQLTRSILFPFEAALSQSLDIEQVALTFDAQGRVNIEVRKRLSSGAYGIYRTTLSAPVTQSYGFAYAVRDRATVEFLQTQTQSGLQTFVFDVRYEFH